MPTMASDVVESDVLSDEQIEQLIQEAETRARAKAGAVARIETEDELILQDETPEFAKRKPLPKLKHGLERQSYIQEKQGVAQVKRELLATKEQQALADQLRTVEIKTKSKKQTERANAGDQWFNLPKTNLTPALKRDLQLISMRSVLDPHRHYKKTTSSKSKIPEFSQTGTLIEGPTEFFSARINRKDRAKNFVEEAMATERANGRFKRKYNEIQEKKTSGEEDPLQICPQKEKSEVKLHQPHRLISSMRSVENSNRPSSHCSHL